MKNIILSSIFAASILAFAADWAAGQCPNGRCPAARPSASVPVNGIVSGTQNLSELEKKIVQIEKDALDKWYAGDPSPYIANMGGDIGYFEPVLDKRLDGKDPLQKMFETKLLVALHDLDPERPVYVEAESRKIGRIHLPTELLDALRAGDCVNIEASFAARVDFLLRDYDYFLNAPD